MILPEASAENCGLLVRDPVCCTITECWLRHNVAGGTRGFLVAGSGVSLETHALRFHARAK